MKKTIASPEKLRVDVSEKAEAEIMIFTQRTEKDGVEKSKKVLRYDYKRCNGCGICVELCPKKAVELGPVIEIATGLDAPPVIIDRTKCSFCGMCAAFCPIKAIGMSINGKDILELTEFPHLDSSVIFNDKCLPCLLCEKACPEEAISVEFVFHKKETIAPFKPGNAGEISVDMEKCTLCGVCAEFCPAFVLVEKKAKADDLMPFDNIVVDAAKCDYCGLCVAFCPEEAIRVKGNFDEEKIKKLAPKITGSIKIDDAKCARCGWCEAVCPYDAAKTTKPFEGEIELIPVKLKRCDPQGCHGCFNVCPAKAWIAPKDKKIDIVRDFCTYCGACEKACHVKAIGVKRTNAKHTEIADASWAREWNKAIICLTTNERGRPDISRALNVEKEEKEIGALPLFVQPNPYKDKVNEKITMLIKALSIPAIRRPMEICEEKNAGKIMSGINEKTEIMKGRMKKRGFLSTTEKGH